MPPKPTPGRMVIPADLADMRRQLDALSRQQTQVITDPTGATGDAAHGHATAVIGALRPITGIAEFGIAVWTGSAWVAVVDTLVNATVSVLPPLPYNGQVIEYQSAAMATDGVVWPLKYRAASASAYKWESIGSQYLSNLVATDQAVSNSVNWQNLGTTGPVLTAPLKGDYEVAWGCINYPTASSLQTILGMGVATTPDGGAASNPSTANPGGDGRSVARRENVANDWGVVTRNSVLNLAAASTVTAVYFVNNPSGSFADRWLKIRPVRVG